jgi:hypothetical protein
MAPKGHFPQASHRALLAQLEAIMPKPATVTLLGDGEFDGVELQAELRHTNWHYVCRTASTILFSACGVQFHAADVGSSRGERLAVSPASMTAQQYSPISLLALWEQHYQERGCFANCTTLLS